jgi:hypothetical protein
MTEHLQMLRGCGTYRQRLRRRWRVENIISEEIIISIAAELIMVR